MLALATSYLDNRSTDTEQAFAKFYSFTKLVQQDDQKEGWTRFQLDTAKHDPNWMSPQFDGFAFRALAFIEYALASNKLDQFYDVIKTDLDGIVKQWQRNDGFEPWEELQGKHFMTLKVMSEALFKGADLASKRNDNAASTYLSTAKTIASAFPQFWNGKWIRSTLNGKNSGNNEGAGAKTSLQNYIDISVILGLNYNQNTTDAFQVTSPQAQATFWALVDSFKNNAHPVPDPSKRLSGNWGLNKLTCSPDGLLLNPAIGRYPEDIYDGTGYEYPGNPDNHVSAGFWFLATNAMAEFLYKSVVQYQALGSITINQDNLAFWKFVGLSKTGVLSRKDNPSDFQQALNFLVKQGDGFLRRTRQHVPQSGLMAEQFHFYSGQQMSTADLTWSYASVVTAGHARNQALAFAQPASGSCQAQKAKPSCPIPGQIKDSSKRDCGFAGITVEQCVDKGCCWTPILRGKGNVPWCYYP
ncbi:Six-hairpin glycosidase-like protein [Gorgonomyces haynaldii]|nr:Six-hairpin glycosidase-like protein [Gorgonomyces haynaldii]